MKLKIVLAVIGISGQLSAGIISRNVDRFLCLPVFHRNATTEQALAIIDPPKPSVHDHFNRDFHDTDVRVEMEDDLVFWKELIGDKESAALARTDTSVDMTQQLIMQGNVRLAVDKEAPTWRYVEQLFVMYKAFPILKEILKEDLEAGRIKPGEAIRQYKSYKRKYQRALAQYGLKYPNYMASRKWFRNNIPAELLDRPLRDLAPEDAQPGRELTEAEIRKAAFVRDTRATYFAVGMRDMRQLRSLVEDPRVRAKLMEDPSVAGLFREPQTSKDPNFVPFHPPEDQMAMMLQSSMSAMSPMLKRAKKLQRFATYQYVFLNGIILDSLRWGVYKFPKPIRDSLSEILNISYEEYLSVRYDRRFVEMMDNTEDVDALIEMLITQNTDTRTIKEGFWAARKIRRLTEGQEEETKVKNQWSKQPTTEYLLTFKRTVELKHLWDKILERVRVLAQAEGMKAETSDGATQLEAIDSALKPPGDYTKLYAKMRAAERLAYPEQDRSIYNKTPPADKAAKVVRLMALFGIEEYKTGGAITHAVSLPILDLISKGQGLFQ